MKVAMAGALTALVAALASGCGGASATDEYCDDVKSAQKEFSTLSGGGADSNLSRVFEKFHELSDAAPDEVADEWKTLEGAVTTIEDAFDDAGLKLSDLDKLQAGEKPAGVDQAELAEIGSKLTSLNDDKFTKASKKISEHAKSECDVDLGSS